MYVVYLHICVYNVVKASLQMEFQSTECLGYNWFLEVN